MKNKKNSRKFWLALTVFSLIGQVAWVVENMYFNVFIYKMFHADAGSISSMVAASAVAATVTTLLVGAWSDKVGKRKLFICGGYILWGITIWSFSLVRQDIITAIFPTLTSAASMGVTITIILDCLMTFFGSSANDACFNAWLTDSTNQTNRGSAEGINAMMPLVAILVVFGGFMAFDLNLSQSWVSIFTIIGLVVIAIGALGIFLIEDTGRKEEENSKFFANIVYGFRPSVIRENVTLYLVLLCFALFNISIQIFMPYLILYYNVSLAMDNYVIIMAPAIIVAAIVTVFVGKIYDRLRFRKTIVPVLELLMVGYIVLYFFKGTVLVFIGSLVMLSGYLGGMAVFGAMIRDHTPENKAGMFQGLRIVGQVLIPGVIGPAIGAAVLKNAELIVNDDGTQSFVPNENIFLAALLAATVVWLVLIPLFQRIKKEKCHAA